MHDGNFFGTTGEILFHNWGIEGAGAKSVYTAEIEYTFPLEFAEVVWSDGHDGGPEDRRADGYGGVRDEDAADSVRRYGEEVGAAGGVGFRGRWRVAAAGAGEVRRS